jgi:hypothetical protein
MLDTESIGTGLALLGTAQVSKDAVQRLLAPTADYIGAGILQGTKAVVNTVRVLANAVKRLGPRLYAQGQAPPRVMREILDQAPFCDDELIAEYLGGILASSYTDVGRDDRGVALLATLKRLSTYAVRTHYICYREYCDKFWGRLTYKPVLDGADLPNTMIAEDTRMFATKQGYATAMNIGENEDYSHIWSHSAEALRREQLLKLGPMGDAAFLSEVISQQEERPHKTVDDGFVYETTLAGGELFLWGIGRGDLGSWLDPLLVEAREDLDVSVPEVSDADGFRPLRDLLVPPNT